MNNDLVKRLDVEQMLKDLGGCDASDKEAAGWDKAIDAAMEGLRKIESANITKIVRYKIHIDGIDSFEDTLRRINKTTDEIILLLKKLKTTTISVSLIEQDAE